MMQQFIAAHRKLIMAIVGGVLFALNAQFGPNNVWSDAVIAVLTAAGVYQVRNG